MDAETSEMEAITSEMRALMKRWLSDPANEALKARYVRLQAEYQRLFLEHQREESVTST